ncbi:MAG: hypothetical protein U5J63_08890 [Fodinibius sp.]|nr:hypothetical protein [Fodinibius sp.]
MKNTKWVAKIGGRGYDMLILLNRIANWLLEKWGRNKISVSKRIKDSVKKAVQFIDDFEVAAMDLAIPNEYDYVICGHIHQPQYGDIKMSTGWLFIRTPASLVPKIIQMALRSDHPSLQLQASVRRGLG